MLINRLSALFFLGLCLTCCNPAKEEGPSVASMNNGTLGITVEAAYGGRISSLRYAGREILKTTRDSANLQWGSTTWSSPQSDWNWPPPKVFDQDRFELSQPVPNEIHLKGAIDVDSGLRMTKRILMPSDSIIILEYQLINEGRDSLNVAIWENTRLPYTGRFEFYADTLWGRWDMLDTSSHEWLTRLHVNEEQLEPGKVFAGLLTGSSTYLNDGISFRKTIFNKGIPFNNVLPEKSTDDTAPGQAPLEIYVDPSARFVEYEAQGRYRRIGPGEANVMMVLWELGLE